MQDTPQQTNGENLAIKNLARELQWGGFAERFPHGCDAWTATDWLVHHTGSLQVAAWQEIHRTLRDYVTGRVSLERVKRRFFMLG